MTYEQLCADLALKLRRVEQARGAFFALATTANCEALLDAYEEADTALVRVEAERIIRRPTV